MFKAIAGGIGVGALGGGLLGSAAGGEGGFGDGLVKGAMVGGLAGAGTSSLVNRGGILNNAMRSFGGMADDMLGNTSQKGYMQAVKGNQKLNLDRDPLSRAVTSARTNFTQSKSAMEDALHGVDSSYVRRGTEAHSKLDPDAIKRNTELRNDIFTRASEADKVREASLAAGNPGIMPTDLDDVLIARTGLRDAKKGLKSAEGRLNQFDNSAEGMRRTANQEIIDAGRPRGSIEDFFYNMGGDAQKSVDANIASYRKMSSKSPGDMDANEYRSLMEMESSLGPTLSQSIRDSKPTTLNSKLAGYEQHLSNARDNIASRNRAMVFGGAGLTGGLVGATSGKRRNHKRGMNSRRGARF